MEQGASGSNETVIDSEQDWRDERTRDIVDKIETLRQSIDNVDMAIVALLAERFKYTSSVGVLKARAGFAPADYKREEEQMRRLRRLAIDAGPRNTANSWSPKPRNGISASPKPARIRACSTSSPDTSPPQHRRETLIITTPRQTICSQGRAHCWTRSRIVRRAHHARAHEHACRPARHNECGGSGGPVHRRRSVHGEQRRGFVTPHVRGVAERDVAYAARRLAAVHPRRQLHAQRAECAGRQTEQRKWHGGRARRGTSERPGRRRHAAARSPDAPVRLPLHTECGSGRHLGLRRRGRATRRFGHHHRRDRGAGFYA